MDWVFLGTRQRIALDGESSKMQVLRAFRHVILPNAERLRAVFGKIDERKPNRSDSNAKPK
jgi:hypothetical protein